MEEEPLGKIYTTLRAYNFRFLLKDEYNKVIPWVRGATAEGGWDRRGEERRSQGSVGTVVPCVSGNSLPERRESEKAQLLLMSLHCGK